ncbi:MAG: peptidylprolyl isomerase [Cytophagales bacterium]
MFLSHPRGTSAFIFTLNFKCFSNFSMGWSPPKERKGDDSKMAGEYTVFGRIVEGLGIIDKIASVQRKNTIIKVVEKVL